MKIFYPYSEVLPSEKARSLQVVNTCCALADAGVEVELYGSFKAPAGIILKNYGLDPRPDLNFVQGRVLRKFSLMGLRLSSNRIFYKDAIKRIIERRAEISYIYTRHIKLADALLKKFPDSSVIYECHELFSVKKRSMFHMEKFVFKNARGIVFISNNLMNKARHYFSLNVPAEVIPDGVNLELIEKAKERNISGDVAYIGQLYPWKGVKTLVLSMKYLPGVKLTIAGGGSKENIEEIENTIKRSGLEGRVSMKGFLPYFEALRYMTGTKVLVLPLEDVPISRYFTSPLKLFEYMASRIPIVASDLPTIKEILTDKESALLVQPGNEREFASAIDRLLKDRAFARRLGDAAYQLSHKYSWHNRAVAIIKFLKGLPVQDGTEQVNR